MGWMRMMGAESVAYHRETVLQRGDDHAGLALDYYASRGETPLAWGGSGAAAFGLSGAVTDEQYDNAFGPGGFRDPTTGTRLVATRRPGVELVISAHKSVALLGVLGWGDVMHAILDAETDATLGYLDRVVQAAGGRRGRAQERTETAGLVYARTRHATSRAADPEPHDHVLIANAVEMLDERGGRKALDTALIRDALHAATMVGRLAAAHRAIEMGLAIEPDPGPSGKLGHWRVAGIPQAACDLFSKRAAEIGRAIADAGYDTYQARQVAARETRKAKRHTPVDELMPRWRAELDAAGLSVEDLARGVLDAVDRRHVARAITARGVDELARNALAPGGRLAEQKVFTRHDAIVAVAPALYGQHPAALDRVIDAVTRHPDAIPLVGVPAARGRVWSPACVVAVESAIVHTLDAALARTDGPRVGGADVERAIWAKEAGTGRVLTVGQTDAVVGICTSGHGADLVLGVAGAGKTTMLDIARDAFESAGYRVVGTSTSGQAARTLGQQAHIGEARTVASLVWRLDHDRLRLDERTVLIVDEAAMTDDPALLRLLTEAVTARTKVVLVGDHRQLGPVGPGGALEGLCLRHPDAIHKLRQNVRQADHEERRALAHLRSGDVAVAVDWYVAHDRIHPAPNRAAAMTAMVDDWYRDVEAGTPAAMLAWRRTNVASLNALARERLGSDGLVTGPVLTAQGGRTYQAGDWVVTLAPAADGSLVTSERGIVSRVTPDGLTLRMDDDRSVMVAADACGAARLDHGYATTVHRTQGDTTTMARRYADGGGRELAYVAMSRATEASHVYAVADDVDQARADLVQDWTHERRQRWAIDTGTPTTHAAEVEQSPHVDERVRTTFRIARLDAEHRALTAAVPPDVTSELRACQWTLHRSEELRTDIERGRGGEMYTQEGRAGLRLTGVRQDLARAERNATNRDLSRSDRRHARQDVERLRPAVAAAASEFDRIAGPRLAAAASSAAEARTRIADLTEADEYRRTWLEAHPEAFPRLARIENELAALRPAPAVERTVVGLERHIGRSIGRSVDGPGLDL